jgi:hypothetical protein
MPKMHITAHFEADMPGATADEMHRHEQLMRDPAYVKDVLAAINDVAHEHARDHGADEQFEITGSIHAVTHHP